MLLLLLALPLGLGCSKSANKDAEFRPGGVWIDGMRASINENVTDADRRDKMLALVDQMQENLNALDGEVIGFYETWGELDRDPTSKRADFEAAYEGLNASLTHFRGLTLDAAFELKGLATREEWDKLGDRDQTIYESWRRTYSMPAPQEVDNS